MTLIDLSKSPAGTKLAAATLTRTLNVGGDQGPATQKLIVVEEIPSAFIWAPAAPGQSGRRPTQITHGHIGTSGLSLSRLRHVSSQCKTAPITPSALRKAKGHGYSWHSAHSSATADAVQPAPIRLDACHGVVERHAAAATATAAPCAHRQPAPRHA